MSQVFDIADAVVTRINDGSYTAPYNSFAAAAVPIVEINLPASESLVVSVVPRGLGMEPLDRAGTRDDHTVGVVVQKNVGVSGGKVNKSDVNALFLLVEQIHAQLRRVNLTAGSKTARWVQSVADPLYDPGALYASQQFQSITNVTYFVTSP